MVPNMERSCENVSIQNCNKIVRSAQVREVLQSCVLRLSYRLFSFLRQSFYDFRPECNMKMSFCCSLGRKMHKNKYLDIHKSFYYFSFISFD